MNIDNFMKMKMSEIKNIISDLPERFSSHDFIEKFSKKYKSEYIGMLVEYKGQNAFQTVHSQIAKFLSLNKKTFEIEKDERNSSENVFGDRDVIQWWINDKEKNI